MSNKDQNTTTANPGEQAEVKPRVVEVREDALQQLLKKVEEQGNEIKKLTEIADRGRLAHWEQTHQEESPKHYRLTMYDDQVVLSWEMVANQTWKDADGKWRENQVIEVRYENNKKQKLPYVEFITKAQKVVAKLKSLHQEGQRTYFEVETEDGKSYTIESTFIN